MIHVADKWYVNFLVDMDHALFPDNNFNEYTMACELEVGRGWVESGPDKALRGYLLSRTENDLTDIIRVGVLPAYQGQGVGSALLTHCLEQVGDAMLTVWKSNTRAVRLYQRFGFEICGELEGDPPSWVMFRTSSSRTADRSSST